ncbi:MAG: hypothetical protein LBI02_09720 [Opitutaceae bacterium]|jgi:hypothetical protein|nr:hypothetical protein [Opitutaceae bacterium]
MSIPAPARPRIRADNSKVRMAFANLGDARPLSKYQVAESTTGEHCKMEPLEPFPVNAGAAVFEQNLPGQSITVYSTHHLGHDAPGVIAD